MEDLWRCEPADDAEYAVRRVTATVPLDPSAGLGCVLVELAPTGGDGAAAIVVVGDVLAGSAAAYLASVCSQAPRRSRACALLGDAIVAVDGVRVEGLGYDACVAAIANARERRPEAITLELARLVRRGRATVEATRPGGAVDSFVLFEGENLRAAFLRRGLERPNDMTVARYDNKPKGSGDCGGNGLCSTCVVSVLRGAEHLSKPGAQETQLLRKGARWRQSCRATLQLSDDWDEQTELDLKLNLCPRGDAALGTN